MTDLTYHLRATDPVRYCAVHATFALDPEATPENDLWLCSDLAAAENLLRILGEAFLSGVDGGGGDQVVPFVERVPELLS
jgi:hypothetical protein